MAFGRMPSFLKKRKWHLANRHRFSRKANGVWRTVIVFDEPPLFLANGADE
jgi:hypothetical protein